MHVQASKVVSSSYARSLPLAGECLCGAGSYVALALFPGLSPRLLSLRGDKPGNGANVAIAQESYCREFHIMQAQSQYYREWDVINVVGRGRERWGGGGGGGGQ